jgi:hypothetical protein
VILRREDVAGRPADFGAQRDQRLDQHGGLDRHVQRAGDARALQGLRGAEFGAQSHQAGHFGFGDGDFGAAKIGQAEVGDHIVLAGFERGGHEAFLRQMRYFHVPEPRAKSASGGSRRIVDGCLLAAPHRQGNVNIKMSLYRVFSQGHAPALPLRPGCATLRPVYIHGPARTPAASHKRKEFWA